MKKGLLILGMLFLLAGCASTQNYQKALESWQGATAQSLVNVWGYPDSTGKAPNGNMLYIYKTESRGTNPVYSSGGGQTTVVKPDGQVYVNSNPQIISGGGSFNLQCTSWFEINKQKRVVRVSSRGNDCQADSGYVKQMSNPQKHIHIKP